MLAHRDQENLVHGRQAAAASKALNHGNKQLNAKTPGNKAPKTPFKVPLNDENNANAFATGKAGLKTVSKVNGTAAKKSVLGDKSNVQTPAAAKTTRAPLGQKTTNAKALAAPPPNLAPDTLLKSKQRSAHKPKPRMSHTTPVTLDVLADKSDGEPEIEYMPPPPANLPDHPDAYIDTLNLSMFQGNHTRGCLAHTLSAPDVDGTSYNDRERAERQRLEDRADAVQAAEFEREMELLGGECVCVPECLTEECQKEPARRNQVEAEFQKKLGDIDRKFAWEGPRARGSNGEKGPKAEAAREAATSLAAKRPAPAPKPVASAPKPKFPASLVSGQKTKTAPINPNPQRHASAVRAANTTMGYSKGRAVSDQRKTILPTGNAPQTKATPTKRKTVLPKKDLSLAEQRRKDADTLAPVKYIQKHGPPPVGTELYRRFKSYGCFDEDGEELEDDWTRQMEEFWVEEGQREWKLTL